MPGDSGGHDAGGSGSRSDNSSLELLKAFDTFIRPGFLGIDYVQGKGKYGRVGQIEVRFPGFVPASVMTAHPT